MTNYTAPKENLVETYLIVSSFYRFWLEAITTALKEKGVTFKIEEFDHLGHSAFNLFVEESKHKEARDLCMGLEKEINTSDREAYTRKLVKSFLESPHLISHHPNPFLWRETPENGVVYYESEVNIRGYLWNAEERGIDAELATTLFNEAGFYQAVHIPEQAAT